MTVNDEDEKIDLEKDMDYDEEWDDDDDDWGDDEEDVVVHKDEVEDKDDK